MQCKKNHYWVSIRFCFAVLVRKTIFEFFHLDFLLAPIACPVGWLFYGSSCYKFSSLRKKWIDAKKDCRASGGYLLKIDDADEQHFITYRQSTGYRVSHLFPFCPFFSKICYLHCHGIAFN